GGVDSGHVLTWPNVPVHLVADACADWGASNTSTTQSTDTTGGGTSAATPYVAGGAVAELMEARRLLGDHRTGVHDGIVAQGRAGLVKSGPLADGKLTLAEWRRVLMTTATARPVAQPTDGPACTTTAGPEWSAVPAAFPEYVAIGYGAVDAPARALATKVLAGTATMPDRSAADRFFSGYDAASSATYTAYSSAP
ncbi:MAG: hypothetical protein JO079_02190, partial [Frankiaceae bacterium]|nr:hypothetical protein [Frankiaceae bacterium]